jgi:hypothetical protein
VLVRTVFGVEPSSVSGMEMPLAVELGENARAVFDRPADDDSLRVTVDHPVDPSALALERKTGSYEILPSGERRDIAAVRVPGSSGIGLSDVTAALTFLTDVPFTLSPIRPPELVPETDEDTAVLDEFGTRQIFRETSAQVGIRTFSVVIDADTIRALIPKAVGLRLYADAMAVNSDVARYRELWRVLESAFRLQEKALVSALASYPPAQQLGFTKTELNELKALRGRVSHAETSRGLDEILRARDLARERGDRLKSLVERVIVTKKTWGAPSLGVHELTPAVSWVAPGGKIVLCPRSDGRRPD